MFKNGLRHGQGIWQQGNAKLGNEEEYEGEYVND
jgi:hypothetical protein